MGIWTGEPAFHCASRGPRLASGCPVRNILSKSAGDGPWHAPPAPKGGIRPLSKQLRSVINNGSILHLGGLSIHSPPPHPPYLSTLSPPLSPPSSSALQLPACSQKPIRSLPISALHSLLTLVSHLSFAISHPARPTVAETIRRPACGPHPLQYSTPHHHNQS